MDVDDSNIVPSYDEGMTEEELMIDRLRQAVTFLAGQSRIRMDDLYEMGLIKLEDME